MNKILQTVPNQAPLDSKHELFPIREVARQTGVNPVTLRAWERRYGLIKPQRTAKGHRLYSTEQIDRVRKVLDWLARGVAVSQVKQLLQEPTLAHSPADSNSPWRAQHEQWFSWIEQLAEGPLDQAYKDVMAIYPPETLCQHLFLPLLHRLQQHWTLTAGARLEQVFFMTWLRTQLSSRISLNNRLHNSAPLLVVSLSEQSMAPELWLSSWLASYSECPVRVLEWPLPSQDLLLAIDRLQPRAVLMYSSQRLNLEDLRELTATVDCPLLLSGHAASIHREALTDVSQLTCADDPLQVYHSLLQLNLIQQH